MSLTVSELKSLAAPMALELARELVPAGKVSGKYYLARSPLRADRHGGSFCVWIKGAAAGAWKDFASDDKGDLVDLIAEVKYGGRSREARGKAILHLRARLGLGGQSPAELSRARAKARAEQIAREAAEIETREFKRRRCLDLWLAGKPLGGTLAEAYLLARGIDAGAIANKSATFRFMGQLNYWKGGVAHRGPAIAGRYRNARGGFPAVHATWLSEDGLSKADLDPPKLSYGEYKGCFLPVTRGISDKEIWEPDCPAGPVMIAEGPEDAWTIAQSRPDLRAWAAGALSNIGNLPDHPAISAFLVVRQNDWETPAAVKAFDRACEALRRHGKPVAEIGVAAGKDPNDQLRGRAGDVVSNAW